jgi:hypothetical protein
MFFHVGLLLPTSVYLNFMYGCAKGEIYEVVFSETQYSGFLFGISFRGSMRLGTGRDNIIAWDRGG